MSRASSRIFAIRNHLLPMSISEKSDWNSLARQSRKQSIEPANYIFPKHKLKTTVSPSKTPLVVVACGSYSPVTYLHLRMFEMGYDYIQDSEKFEIIGGYFSPVSDAYAKPGLAPWYNRVDMCSLATQDSSWIMVDPWEPSQPAYVRTARVLDHFNEELNGKDGGILMPDGIMIFYSRYQETD
jgi:nicotinamide mononucleotide adenylyltransferase